LSDGDRPTGAERSLAILPNSDLNLVQQLSGISVFLLAHNKEDKIERVVEGFKAELPKLTDGYEIIVFNDGSSDHTGQIAERMVVTNSHIRVLHHALNRGYRAAVISGIYATSKPYVLLSDGDGQFDKASGQNVADIAKKVSAPPIGALSDPPM
jgi:glycosyltransferase involved in cell wall biosynthesis